MEDQLPWAEVDLRLTRDGQLVLSRDASVVDAAGKRWEISSHSWAELSKVDVGSRFAARFAGERLLSLEECFALCRGKLNLRLNCRKVIPEQLAQQILGAGMERQVIVFADLNTLQRVRSASGDKLALMAEWRPAFGTVEWAITNCLAAVEVDGAKLTRRIRQRFRQAGIRVQARFLTPSDRPELWDRAMKAGADWLLTEFPEELLAHAFQKRFPRHPVQVSFHRGAALYAPENTLAAFDKAVRMGADLVEFDVRTTRDGAFMLLHDSRLDRTTDGHGPLNQIDAAAAGRLSAGVKFGQPFASEPIPTLEDFLTTFAGKTGFYFDAKAIPPPALASALVRHKVVKRTVVYQSPQYLAELKQLNPAIRGLAPLQRPEDVEALSRLKPYAVDADWSILSRELIARCHAAGMKVFSDALDDHERIENYRQAIEWGIDVIQTDHPLRVMRAIELKENDSSRPETASRHRDSAR